MAFDIYSTITDRIIAALEKGTVPWHKTWTNGSGCISYATGKPYSLLNHILLNGVSGEYITFKQCEEAGGRIKKGEKARMVVFWKMIPKDKTAKENEQQEIIPLLRYYNVFHLSQCEGISPRWSVETSDETDLIPEEKAEALIENYRDQSGIRLTVTESDNAFYQPESDEVTVPKLSQFQQIEEYYSTVFHELIHSTGHKSRLNRLASTVAFGGIEYSKEELVAELGSAFLVNYVGLESPGSFNNSAAYIDGWLRVLRKDKRLLVTASGAAEKAVEYVLNNQLMGNFNVGLA